MRVIVEHSLIRANAFLTIFMDSPKIEFFEFLNIIQVKSKIKPAFDIIREKILRFYRENLNKIFLKYGFHLIELPETNKKDALHFLIICEIKYVIKG